MTEQAAQLNLSYMSEGAIDLAVAELFHMRADFSTWFYRLATGLDASSTIASIAHSVFDASSGETDLEVVFHDGRGNSHALLLENKINAPIMPRQFERYVVRGAAGLTSGKWQSATVVLMAPAYYEANMPLEHKPHIGKHISYEEILAWLRDNMEQAGQFKIRQFEMAIAGHRTGYVQRPDDAMMRFYASYYALAASRFPQLKMKKPDIVGGGGTWIYFPSPYPEMSTVRLIHKFKLPAAELGVPTDNSLDLAETLLPLLPETMSVRSTKTWVFVGMPTAMIDHAREFDVLTDPVIDALEALEQLRQFALRPEVRSIIKRYV